MPRPDHSGSQRSRRGSSGRSSSPKKFTKKSAPGSRSGAPKGAMKKRSGSFGSSRDEYPRRKPTGESGGSSERKSYKKSSPASRSTTGGKSFSKKDSKSFGSARDDFRKRKSDQSESTGSYPKKSFTGRKDSESRSSYPKKHFTGRKDSESPSSYPKKRFTGRKDSESASSYPKKRVAGRRDEDQNEKRTPSKRSFTDRSGGSKARFEKEPYERPSASKRSTRAPRTRTKSVETEAPVQTEKMRLNRYIANSGVCSRREADELITMGLISVNGKVITEMGYKVNPGDEVRYEKKLLKAEKPVYILMNKPKGFLTTTNDPQERNTVMHLIGNKVKERIYPVGRLDRNTTGLLLLTNDGDLADKLMHPSYNVKKIYKVDLDRPLSRADFQKILDGVHLEEGKAQVDDLAIVSDDGKTVGIEIHIGWNRVVRRIFESLEYEVLKLDRSVYAGLDKKDLPRGEWRFLSREEIVRLKHYK
jgi:23S rRNA pseudouridine2605 synthase